MKREVFSFQFPVLGKCRRSPFTARARRRAGITLTEILIAIMILGIGLVSLATLFPIGLLRLREAARWSRSATLMQTAASDAVSRGLMNGDSFNYAVPWHVTPVGGVYNPLVQDTISYGGDWLVAGTPPTFIGANANPFINYAGIANNASVPGLPVAYDPLWRFQALNPGNQYANNLLDANGQPTQPGGYYLFDPGAVEARFGNGVSSIRADAYGGGAMASAHGLQRITNFNRPYFINNGKQVPVMPSSLFLPNIFVSQEDVVWQDPNVKTYTINGNSANPVTSPSPILPDFTPPQGGLAPATGTPSLDWRFSWMVTGQLTSSSNYATFDGNIVIFENRPFGVSPPSTLPINPQGPGLDYQVDGETVVEGVFGFSTNLLPAGGPGYGTAADRTVLLRWPATMPDPVVRPGDWIADVTYERSAAIVATRFLGFGGAVPAGLANPANNFEWDNLPAQRCFWYQVQKVSPAVTDTSVQNHRSMVVNVNQTLQARTILQANGQPLFLNAALIVPNVVNVIPQTIFVR
jgi:type II secretory pathway pseudopilin PulG